MSTSEWYDTYPETMTETEYVALPENVAQMIEVVYGRIIRCESAAPEHNRIARRLANAIEAARSPLDPSPHRAPGRKTRSTRRHSTRAQGYRSIWSSYWTRNMRLLASANSISMRQQVSTGCIVSTGRSWSWTTR